MKTVETIAACFLTGIGIIGDEGIDKIVDQLPELALVILSTGILIGLVCAAVLFSLKQSRELW